jgi:hypothetical protein
VVRGVIDCLAENPPRLPDQKDQTASLAEVNVPRLGVRIGSDSPGLVLLWIETLRPSLTNLC